jgi:cellulose synthase/poly-beta-1,6-N-acetylglucosamine synthase-like glycosyltransferase
MVQEELSLNNVIKKKNSKDNFRFFFKNIGSSIYKDSEKFHNINFPDENNSKKIITGGLRYEGLFKNSIKDYPLISIIMPNYKEKNLLNAISSISNQNYENIELIVIDGNSGLDVTNLLRENNNEIDIWLSEDDKGLWDAWNKGFKLARGDFVGVVDSSNLLYKNSINILKDYIIRYKEIDFICGTVKKGSKIYSGFRPRDIKKQFNIV